MVADAVDSIEAQIVRGAADCLPCAELAFAFTAAVKKEDEPAQAAARAHNKYMNPTAPRHQGKTRIACRLRAANTYGQRLSGSSPNVGGSQS